MIDCEEVGFRYAASSAPAIRDLDLRIGAGECVVLCGASGSGKSTVLQLLNGLIPHTYEGTLTGTVTVGGQPTTVPLERLAARAGTVLQHPRSGFFTRAAQEELAFGLENWGWPPQTIRDRVDAELVRIDVAPGDRHLLRLSGGQQQRVALSAATLHDPALLLLDEPTANLSAAAIDTLAADIAAWRQRGTTIVIADHRLHYLAPLADRYLLMADGRLVETWTATEFANLGDDMLRAHGLRPSAPPSLTALPLRPALGASVERPGPPPSGPGLELRQLRLRRGDADVLDLEQVHFPAGAVTALTGPNGAGKTSLARCLVGLERPRGTILLDGVPQSPRRLRARGALVMQDVQRQLFGASVLEEIQRADHTLTASQAAAILADFDLDAHADRHPLALSGGQQQRLVVAATEASGRDVVVFDEPSSGVDRTHLESIADAITRQARRGAVVVVISHDEELLARSADAVLRLRPL